MDNNVRFRYIGRTHDFCRQRSAGQRCAWAEETTHTIPVRLSPSALNFGARSRDWSTPFPWDWRRDAAETHRAEQHHRRRHPSPFSTRRHIARSGLRAYPHLGRGMRRVELLLCRSLTPRSTSPIGLWPDFAAFISSKPSPPSSTRTALRCIGESCGEWKKIPSAIKARRRLSFGSQSLRLFLPTLERFRFIVLSQTDTSFPRAWPSSRSRIGLSGPLSR